MNIKILCFVFVSIYKIRNEGALAIVFGQPAGELEKLYTVSIQARSHKNPERGMLYICTGTIIGRFWVIALIRCISEPADYIIVHNTTVLPGGLVSNVVDEFYKYSGIQERKGVTCMLKVLQEFSVFQEFSLSLPEQGLPFPLDIKGWLSGWAANGNTMVLTKLEIQIPSDLRISRHGRFNLGPFNYNLNRDEDHGAPLVCNGMLIANAYKSEKVGKLDGFTRISTYTNWINELTAHDWDILGN